MAKAIEKFQKAMNRNSPFWTKNPEVIAQEGEIVIIKCDGFVFKSDPPIENSSSTERK